MACFEVIILKNRIERAFISLPLDLINVKDTKTSMSAFQNLDCLSLVVWSNTT